MSNRTTLLAAEFDQSGAARGRETRLGLAADHFEAQADFLAHLFDEFGAIFGGATSFGGDETRARDAARHHFVAANQQRVEGPANRRVAQPAALAQALAQADDARKGVDDAKIFSPAMLRIALGARDQQAAIIGAEVKGGIGGGNMRRIDSALGVTRLKRRRCGAADRLFGSCRVIGPQIFLPAAFRPYRQMVSIKRGAWGRQANYGAAAKLLRRRRVEKGVALAARLGYVIRTSGAARPVGDSSTVELRTLTPSILVRIQVSQPNFSTT